MSLATRIAQEFNTLRALFGAADGLATLDSSGKVPSTQLPSYVDEVMEAATYADLPTTGENSKIYIVIADETQENTTSTYRWTGTVYALVSQNLTAADVLALLNSATGNVTVDGVQANTITNKAGTGATDAPYGIKSEGNYLSPYGFKNKLINPNFQINQRGVSGTVVLAAGEYGHDRYKGGASGCTYTFSSSGGITTITISAGSLIQVVEGNNLITGTYCLSWAGTAQGKIGAGSFSSSGVTGSVTGGSNLNIEFGTGTISKLQLEQGSFATPFEHRPYGLELSLCKSYARDLRFFYPSLYNYTSSTLNFLIPLDSLRDGAPVLTFGVEGTDWGVYTKGGVLQSGFTLGVNGVVNGNVGISASKSAHGLTDAVLIFGTFNKNIISVEL